MSDIGGLKHRQVCQFNDKPVWEGIWHEISAELIGLTQFGLNGLLRVGYGA